MNLVKLLLLIWLLGMGQRDATRAKPPDHISGKVIAVKDGDTIELLYEGRPLTIRLKHIDCPELNGSQPFGAAAKRFTSNLCFGKTVQVMHHNEFDRYGRLIGIVINEKQVNVNQALLKAGFAWHFKKYSKSTEYARLEEKAKRLSCGLWADSNPTPPWIWRRHKRMSAL